MRRGSRLATRRWRASISRATSSTRSGTTPSLHARHNTPHVALNCACVLSSDLLVGRRMAVSFGIEFYHDLVDSAVEVIRTVERLMCEVMPLQVAPENIDVVQLRSIFRQPLDREPVGALYKGLARRHPHTNSHSVWPMPVASFSPSTR